ncbi:MAG: hypothetical protein DMF69_02945 [Acidobacteria bacterium]|nr:MAG: hypothetical protein DMF69_02945 [Acidobacteriota bacterium]
MFYTVAGRVVLIEAHDEWSVDAVSALFSGWFLDPISIDDAAACDATIRVHCGVSSPAIPSGLSSFEIALGGTCHTDNRSFYIEIDGSLVRHCRTGCGPIAVACAFTHVETLSRFRNS